jgi:hypothetical protein
MKGTGQGKQHHGRVQNQCWRKISAYFLVLPFEAPEQAKLIYDGEIRKVVAPWEKGQGQA